MNFDKRSIALTFGGAASIVTGMNGVHYSLKGSKHEGFSNVKRKKLLGASVVLAFGGWATFLTSFGIDNPVSDNPHSSDVLAIVSGIAVILGTMVFFVNYLKIDPKKWIDYVFYFLLIGGYLTLATFSSFKTDGVEEFNGTKAAFNYPGAVSAILGTLLFMNNIGMSSALELGGLMLIGIGHALRP